MDTTQVVWLIVGIVVVLAIIWLITVLVRRRQHAANKVRAGQLREKAQVDDLAAREKEAKAARADAEAKEAALAAEKLKREAQRRQDDADSIRQRADEQLRTARKLDPEYESSQHAGQAGEDAGGSSAGRHGQHAGGPVEEDRPAAGESGQGSEGTGDSGPGVHRAAEGIRPEGGRDGSGGATPAR